MNSHLPQSRYGRARPGFWAVLCIVIATVILGASNLPQYYKFAHEGIRTMATVIAKQPTKHRFVDYSYMVGSNKYCGAGGAGFGNPKFEEISVGDQVKIAYLPADPASSFLGDPQLWLAYYAPRAVFVATVIPLAVLAAARYLRRTL
ncbi:MAG TPA: DUF3592 domain-containing protein [Candidatus Sulfotelmatobacter sp.]|nr:DUF3592 domain-containing protein [Candidatus Sulfotelmatobacter sp.]